MSLTLPEKLADKAITFPESSYGANRVTLVLRDGRRVSEVYLGGGTEIVKIGSRAVTSPEDLGFALVDIVDVVSEVGVYGTRMTSMKTLLWLVPILITVHNLEEAILMPAVLAKRNSTIPSFTRGLLLPITYRQFLVALFVMTAIPYLIAWLACREQERPGVGTFLLLSLQFMMLVNVFAHLGMALLMSGYAPGLVTALAINLPFSIYLLHHAIKQRWLSWRAMALIIPTGLLFHAIGLPMIIILSGRIVTSV